MKKIIALLMVMAIMLMAVACGNNTNNETTPTTEPTSDVVDNEQTEGTEGTEDGEGAVTEGTVGEVLYADFKTKATGTAQEIADGLLQNPVIQFMGMAMPVEPGYLTGFDNAEITGFSEAVMFAPAIGTIPFVGYIFVLEDGANVDAFKQNLEDNANLRWNICTAAEELIVESEGNTVFFLMCPTSFEQPEGEGDMGVGDMGVGDMEQPGDENGIPAFDGETVE